MKIISHSIFLAFGLALGLALAFFLLGYPPIILDGGVATWVQALGPLGALAVAIGLGWYQAAEARKIARDSAFNAQILASKSADLAQELAERSATREEKFRDEERKSASEEARLDANNRAVWLNGSLFVIEHLSQTYASFLDTLLQKTHSGPSRCKAEVLFKLEMMVYPDDLLAPVRPEMVVGISQRIAGDALHAFRLMHDVRAEIAITRKNFPEVDLSIDQILHFTSGVRDHLNLALETAKSAREGIAKEFTVPTVGTLRQVAIPTGNS